MVGYSDWFCVTFVLVKLILSLLSVHNVGFLLVKLVLSLVSLAYGLVLCWSVMICAVLFWFGWFYVHFMLV